MCSASSVLAPVALAALAALAARGVRGTRDGQHVHHAALRVSICPTGWSRTLLKDTSGISAQSTTAINSGVGTISDQTIQRSNFMCMKYMKIKIPLKKAHVMSPVHRNQRGSRRKIAHATSIAVSVNSTAQILKML